MSTHPSKHAAFRPPDDLPTDADANARLVHTRHAVDVLGQLVKRELQSGQGTDGGPRCRGFCIGLLGGLGQGKTQVLRTVCQGLRGGLFVKGLLGCVRRPNVVCFDVGNHSSAALEFEFAQLQAALNPLYWFRRLALRTLFAIFFVLCVLGLMLWVATGNDAWAPQLEWLGSELVKLKPGAFTPSGLLLFVLPWLGWASLKTISAAAQRRKELEYFWTNGSGERSPNWLGRWFQALFSSLRRIDVLVIDNLDRANLTQQRAILRTLYKARGDLPYCVVVAFDEQALLDASPDPEAPEALLHKALQATIRLAPRHPVEGLSLAHLAAQSLPESDAWRSAFLQPAVLAVFARVLSQMPNLSPRLAKRFMADVGVGLQVIDDNSLEKPSSMAPGIKTTPVQPDVLARRYAPALLRIRGVEELCPGALRAADGLAQCLAGYWSGSMWQAEVIQASDKDKGSPGLNRALRFIELTRDIQPAHGDWASFVMVLWGQRWNREEATAVIAPDAPPSLPRNEHPPDLRALHHIWRTLDQTSQVGVADQQRLDAFAGFWALGKADVKAHLGVDDLSLDIAGPRAALWLAYVLELWLDHRPAQLERATALHQLRRALCMPGSWLAAPGVRPLVCAALVRAALRGAVCKAERAELLEWLDLDEQASDLVRLERLALCDPSKLNACDVWVLASAASGQQESHRTADSAFDRPFDNELIVSWLQRVRPCDDLSDVFAMCVALRRRGDISASVAAMLAATWPRLADTVTGARTLTAVQMRKFMSLKALPTVGNLELPVSFVAAVQQGGYKSADVWHLMCYDAEATEPVWSLGTAKQLIKLCQGLARPPIGREPLAVWCLPPHAYLGYLLWAAMLGQADFRRAWEEGVTHHQNVWAALPVRSDKGLTLLHEAILAAQDNWCGDPSHDSWLRDEALRPCRELICANAELSTLPVFGRLFAEQIGLTTAMSGIKARPGIADSNNLPIVFIHGLVGSWDELDLTKQFLAFRCYAPDLKGYGEFRNADGAMDIPAQVAHVLEVLDSAFGDPEQKFHLVAHSVGGVIALDLAHHRPDQVASLVMVETNFTPADAFWCKGIAAKSVAEVEADLTRWREQPEALFGEFSSGERETKLRIAKGWLHRQDGRALHELATSVLSVTFAEGYEESVRKVVERHRVHLLAGSLSAAKWQPFQWLKAQVSMQQVPDAGHMVMLDQPAATAQIIRQLLLPKLADEPASQEE